MTFILLKFLKGKQVIKSVKRIKIKKDIRTGPNSQIEKKKSTLWENTHQTIGHKLWTLFFKILTKASKFCKDTNQYQSNNGVNYNWEGKNTRKLQRENKNDTW